jgi:hypothetical protein
MSSDHIYRKKKKGVRHRWLTPVIVAAQKVSQGNKSETLSQKYPTLKRADGVAQLVECLLGKCEALSSNPSATKQKEEDVHSTRRQWLMPVILATWETEISRITV